MLSESPIKDVHINEFIMEHKFCTVQLKKMK